MNQERDRLALLNRLDAGTTSVERNRRGQFATPPQLAFGIVARALSFLTSGQVRFLEPGFGTGAFYSALRNADCQIEAASGFELDPYYGEAAQRLWNGTGLNLAIGDFSTTPAPTTEAEKFNLVICNPPYVRHHHLESQQKKELQIAVARATGLELNGLAGLYVYFLLLSQRWMSQGGVGAWLIPSEFMDVNYGRVVKQFLLENVTLNEIHRCDPQEVQFDDALVSSAILFFTNSPPPKSHRIKLSFGGSLHRPTLSQFVATNELREVSKWTRLPQQSVQRAASRSSTTLADLFTIKRGVATGRNSFFIHTPESVVANELPQKFLVPILPSPKDLEVNEVFSGRHGFPQIAKPRFLLSCDLPERDVQSRYPALWRYYQRGMADGIHERYICRHRSPWYSQETRPPAPFLCTYMGRTTKSSPVPFRFVLNHSKATAANVYLLIYPRPGLERMLVAYPELLKRIWEMLSKLTAEMLTDEGRIYGGGLHKLEPKELANVSAEAILKILPSSRGRKTQQCLFV